MKSISKIALVLLALAVAPAAFAQTEQCPYIDNPAHKEPLSKQMKERMVELCIKETKKDFAKLLERSEEVARLSDEIERSYQENQKLSSEDRKKLEKAEKLLRKIRKELRASNKTDKKNTKDPPTVVAAIKSLKENTAKLLKEIKKTSRHSISAVAIQSSNTVLRLVKFLRFTN